MANNAEAPEAPLRVAQKLSREVGFNSNFNYPQIQPHTNIRVLKLLGHNPRNNYIQCEFRVLRDIKLGEHAALSYTWGREPSNDANLWFLEVDEQPFAIRRNVHTFLLTIFHGSKRGSPTHNWWEQLWFIDAICINQADVSERSQQVKLMRDVYANAKEVALWTPIPNYRAMFGFDRFYKRFDHRYNSGAGVSPSQWTSDERVIFTRLFDHDYWERMWIVQEVLLAKRLTMFVGYHPFALDEFILVNFPAGYNKHKLDWGRASHVISEWSSFETNRTDHGGIPIDQALRSFGSQKCTISTDKVYGLLGLLNPSDPNIYSINPDYTKTDAEVLRDIFPALLLAIKRRISDRSAIKKEAQEWLDYLGSILDISKADKPKLAPGKRATLV